MATDPSSLAENVGRITAPDANYLYGSAKDDTTGTTGDGTPFKAALLNDIYGFQQAMLKAAAVVPSGNADTAIASQYLDSLDILFPRKGTANNITGVWEWQDDVQMRFGNSNDVDVRFQSSGGGTFIVDLNGTTDFVLSSDSATKVQFDEGADRFDFKVPMLLQDDKAVHFGGGIDASLFFDPAAGVAGILTLDLLNGAGLVVHDDTTGLDALLYTPATQTFVFGKDIDTKQTGDLVENQINFLTAGGAVNRYLLGDIFDSDDWTCLGTVPGGTAGVRNFSLDMRRQVEGATPYVRCEFASTLKAEIAGNGRVKGTGTFVDLSDLKTKENVRELSDVVNSTALVMGLRPKRFDRREAFGGDKDVDGFIADDWVIDYPQAVEEFDDGVRRVHDKDARGGFKYASPKDKAAGQPMFKDEKLGDALKGIQISNVIPHLVAMNQSQQRTIDALAERLAILEND